jgi:hypothetical protein
LRCIAGADAGGGGDGAIQAVAIIPDTELSKPDRKIRFSRRNDFVRSAHRARSRMDSKAAVI